MVIGIPNCGKSTLINSLLREKKVVTGNKPGVTRGKQWVAIDRYIELLDSPGVLYPDFKDQQKAIRLAMIGSIKDDIVDSAELALEVIDFFSKNYPEALKSRYSLQEISEDKLVVMEAIAKKRGFVVRGGEYDYDRTATAIIQDFRKGYLGKITLENCENE